MNLEERYRALAHAVSEKGEHFRKAHGEWVRLRLDDDPEGPFLELDTWNRQLILKYGAGDYEYWGGFAPWRFSRERRVEVLGIVFGSFSLYVTPTRLATYERLVAAA